MVYTDKTHLVADTLVELHLFANKIGLKRHFYQGVKKKHPHYDLTNNKIRSTAIQCGAQIVSNREVMKICKRAGV